MMTDSVATAEMPGEKKPKRTRPRPARPDNGLSVPLAGIAEKTPLETFRRKKAVTQLREALAMHQPVVKMCVAERLSKHLPYAELAKKFFLTVEEVADIMEKMRAWVRKYTLYFENDWYWKDEGQPRKLMPDPK